MSHPREHVGIWTGPGLLALVNGQWVHYLPKDAPRDLTIQAAAVVGTDRPHICIRLVEDPGNAAQDRM